MKKFALIITVLTVILVGCKKFDNVGGNEPTGSTTSTNPNSTITSMSDLSISNSFDWRTIKTVSVLFNLPEDGRLEATRIYSPDGEKLFFKGYPEDGSRTLSTLVTVPTYIKSVLVKYGDGTDVPMTEVPVSDVNVTLNMANLKTGGGNEPEFDCLTMWALDDNNPGNLYYITLNSDPVEVFTEGDIEGLVDAEDMESLAIDTNGDMYFINVKNDDKLYKIPFSEIDKNENTDVNATLIGLTNVPKITNLTFIGEFLYGVGQTSKKVYKINTSTGNAVEVGDLSINGSFTVDGITEGFDGTVYLTHTVNLGPSELWKFNSFPNGGITKVMDIAGSKKVESLAAHPNGLLYAADDFKFFEMDPINLTTTVMVEYESDIEGIDFYWVNEEECYNGDDDDDDDDDDSYSGTFAVEDLWPGKGDYDINDLVIEYDFDVQKNNLERVNRIIATFTIRAFGADLHNGFGFELPNVNPSDIVSVTGYDIQNTTSYSLAANGVENAQSNAVFILYDDAYRMMQHPGQGIGVNTDKPAPYVTPVTMVMEIEFVPNAVTYSELNIGTFNPFIVVNQNRDMEVHLPNYKPTDLADPSFFGTADDNTDPGANRYYKTHDNLFWAINIPERFDYPVEKQVILGAYLHFAEWAQSDGTLYQDWYQDKPGYRNASVIY